MLTADCAATDESHHVCHKGYLSLFPFLLGLLPPDSPHLGAILDLLRDPEHLWSPYGLRSLSAAHPEFGQGENYWKGPIWIQMNFLALKALYKVGSGVALRLGWKLTERQNRRMLHRRGLIKSKLRRSTLS